LTIAAARTSPMPFSVASSFSEAVLMSIGSAFLASALVSLAGSAFLASAFGASVFLASVALVSFWAKAGAATARPNAARLAVNRAKNLFMKLVLLVGWIWAWSGLCDST